MADDAPQLAAAAASAAVAAGALLAGAVLKRSEWLKQWNPRFAVFTTEQVRPYYPSPDPTPEPEPEPEPELSPEPQPHPSFDPKPLYRSSTTTTLRARREAWASGAPSC